MEGKGSTTMAEFRARGLQKSIQTVLPDVPQDLNVAGTSQGGRRATPDLAHVKEAGRPPRQQRPWDVQPWAEPGGQRLAPQTDWDPRVDRPQCQAPPDRPFCWTRRGALRPPARTSQARSQADRRPGQAATSVTDVRSVNITLSKGSVKRSQIPQLRLQNQPTFFCFFF